jgi:two-component system response regulator QseB
MKRGNKSITPYTKGNYSRASSRDIIPPSVPVMPHRHEILVVEDDSAFSAEIEQVFGESGYHVTVVTSTVGALMRLEENEYGAIVLDLVLENGSGVDVLARLRETNRDTPVIVVTQFLQDYLEAATGLFAAVKLIVSKPYPARALLANVASITGVTQMRA